MGVLTHEFRNEGRGRDSEWARQRRWFIKARHDLQRKEELAEKADSAQAMAGMVAATMATGEQIQAFERKLDRYEARTVEALLNNQDKLDEVQARLDAYLSDAYVMDDGRRVFATRDRTRVFDEDGMEVSGEELDIDLIPATAPSWEDYRAARDEERALEVERSELLEFQERLDEARDEIADGEISEEELEALDNELMAAMPMASKAGNESERQGPGTVKNAEQIAGSPVQIAAPINAPTPS